MSDGSSDEEDYDAFEDVDDTMEKKYPLHDCVEFEDIETLRNLLYIEVEGEERERKDDDDDDSSSSSSDENDSTAAAHAAAIGHSPQPFKATLNSTPEGAENGEDAVKGNGVSTGTEMEKGNGLSTGTEMEINEASTKNVQDKEKDQGPSSMEVDGEDDEQKVKEDRTEECPTKIKKKLERDLDIHINERDEDENTALHIAILSRKLDHVKLLLEAGASFRLRCDGSLPIHTAISMGAVLVNRQFSYECVVTLHEHGADLTAKDDSLHTPLYLTCMFNQPQIASYILSDEEGVSTLNARSDRAGNRPLHAAARYDTIDNPALSKSVVANATGQLRSHHHPDGSVVSSMHTIPGVTGELDTATAMIAASSQEDSEPGTHSSTEALMTQVLLGSPGIEIDATNVMGRTPLHVACSRGNWSVVRLLIQAGASTSVVDRRGFTPGQVAYKKGMSIPNDLIEALGDPPETGTVPPLRDLLVDPDGRTMVICHELCLLHRTCPPIRRNSPDPPPENVRRLHVLVDAETGILQGSEFSSLLWKKEARRVAISDVLKVHDYNYVETISRMASSIPDHPNAIAHLDGDTAISRWSFEAAMRAAGSVCEAVDKVIAGDLRNAFCAVRPPGHHAGPRGIVKCANDPEGGSHGFCLLNNVAIGAAYARSMYRNEGIQRIAIVDFDVHHGNGTEEIIRQLVPNTERTAFRTPYAIGELSQSTFRPWLDETDIQNVFFSSTHGYGNRGFDQPGWFYPASGKTHTSDAIAHPAMVENPNMTDFILSQTWARMGEDSKSNCCKIINIGLELPEQDSDPQARSMKQRLELRDTYRKKIFPHLREFDPDIIFISAGFDAHRRDTMNFGYVGMVEDDYEWVTEQLVKIANTCCNGRIVSVLEGGYKIHGGIVSPFARSVASHVRALVDGSKSRELYDAQDCDWESTFEHHLFEKREKKKEQERDQLRAMEEVSRRAVVSALAGGEDGPEDPDAPSRKRRRNQVDYKELYKKMQQEGFGD